MKVVVSLGHAPSAPILASSNLWVIWGVGLAVRVDSQHAKRTCDGSLK